jgi:hypothetical protein
MIDPTMLHYLAQTRIDALLREAAADRLADSVRENRDPRPAYPRLRLAWPNLTPRLARLRRNVAL